MEKLKYVVVEWIHWSGKSTIAKYIAKKLKEQWFIVKYLHFPDEESHLGKVIRATVRDEDIYKYREVVGLLYAAASNSFHIKTKDDNTIYILDRDAVTSGLIFQKNIPREVRTEIYKFGIENLGKMGKVIYVKTNKITAQKRSEERNKELWQLDQQVRKDKAGDKFIETKFDELSQLYDTELLPQLEKLGLSYTVIENNETIEKAWEEALNVIYKSVQ